MKKLLVLLAITLTGCSTYNRGVYRPSTFEYQYNFLGSNQCWNSTYSYWNPYWNNFSYGGWWVRPYYWNYNRPTRPQVTVPRRGNSNINRPVQTVRPNYRTAPTRPSSTRVRSVNKKSKNLRRNN